MNPQGKKFLSLLLVFSLLTINCAYYRKKFGIERRGAKLIITTKNGQQIEGELFAVKKDSLILLHTRVIEASFGIEEIKFIRIVRKSKALSWAGWGALGGGSLAMSLVFAGFAISEQIEGRALIPMVGIGVGIGALIGAIIGGIGSEDETIPLIYMTDSEIQKTLKKLRKKARIRNNK